MSIILLGRSAGLSWSPTHPHLAVDLEAFYHPVSLGLVLEANGPMPLLQNLKRIREAHRMDVRQLSATSGVSADSIRDFEELRRMASLRTAGQLAEALGVRAEDLE